MFSCAKKVQRGKCACCGIDKTEELKLYVLDLRDSSLSSRSWEPKLVESDADFAACLKCWKFIGGYISNHVRVQSYV